MHRAASSSPFSPREERVGRGPSRGEINKNAPPLPSPLLHPMEEREKSRSLMQPWPRQRLDSVGATPTGAIETVALRTAGVLARSNSTTNRIINLEQILDGKRTYLLALAALATRLSTANGIVPMPTPAPANPPSATRILHSRARRAAAGEDARAPSPKASGERKNLHLSPLITAYHRLMGEKCLRGSS